MTTTQHRDLKVQRARATSGPAAVRPRRLPATAAFYLQVSIVVFFLAMGLPAVVAGLLVVQAACWQPLGSTAPG